MVTFDAPPGALQLRMMVEGSKGETLDSVTREIKVPDFTQVAVGASARRASIAAHGQANCRRSERTRSRRRRSIASSAGRIVS